MKKKLIFSAVLVLSLGLAACGEEKATEEPQKEETQTPASTDESETTSTSTWKDEISALATNEDAASDKFYALEKFMMDYRSKVTTDEVEQFKKEIIDDYKSGTYLSELENHERMLTNIFKSYIVEQNSEDALKDFAFDYFQNLKYTYRGADTVDSEAVKSNEDQMNKALDKM
ncbi:hypothetical protein [Lysinibacillus pakistanensis]|uniref:hypothetical protein n=1 Tax=Lysinibacillus pakistanensis TaxID=759811 RepID=UPI003D2A0D4C